MLEPDREENTQLRKASLLSNSPFRCDAKPPSFGACATSSEHSVLSKSALCWAQGLFEASSGAPRDNLGDKLADKLRPGGPWIGDNSALQDSGAPGLSEDNLGDKLADKLGDNVGPRRPGLETILRYRIPGPRDCPRTIWATNWRTN